MAVPIRYPGRFRSADRAVDPQTGTLEITLDFPNPRLHLLPGTFSRVRVQTGEKSGVFLVPQRAITELQGVRTVYVVDNEEKVVARTVTAGERMADLWAIEKGLEAGDRVIVEGIQRVQPGMKVQSRRAGAGAKPQPTDAVCCALVRKGGQYVLAGFSSSARSLPWCCRSSSCSRVWSLS